MTLFLRAMPPLRRLAGLALLGLLPAPLWAAELAVRAPAELEEPIRAASLSQAAVNEDRTDPQDLVAAAQSDYRRVLAALYEQGRVFHLPGLAALEDQLCAMTSRGYEGRGSPDRLDALVWALHELMIVPSGMHREPRVRTL